MTAPPAESPWAGIARQDAHEWFRDHRGAPWAEFYEWAAEVWEPEQFLRAGFGWVPGQQPVNRAALTDAHLGLAAAMEGEWRRRRDVPQWAAARPVEPPAVPAARVGANPWRHGLQRDGAA